MSEKLKEHLVEAVACLLYGVIFWFAATGITNQLSPKHGETKSDTTKVTIIDTIPYYKPVAKDSMVVRYERVKLPTSDDKPYYASVSITKPGNPISAENYAHKSAGNIPDSVSIDLPITQKRYGDSTYTAWVSGYNPTLDSIYVYPRHETVTITNTIRQKPRRWGLGVSAGYGYAPGKGMVPWVGVGVSYTLITF